MGGITRRSSTFPDAATLTAIEGVFIADEAPMGAVQGSPSGTVCFVGEYEDGGFATDPAQPADVFHPPGGAIAVPRDKWAERVGTLGYSFQGVRNQFPCPCSSTSVDWRPLRFKVGGRKAFTESAISGNASGYKVIG